MFATSVANGGRRVASGDSAAAAVLGAVRSAASEETANRIRSTPAHSEPHAVPKHEHVVAVEVRLYLANMIEAHGRGTVDPHKALGVESRE